MVFFLENCYLVNLLCIHSVEGIYFGRFLFCFVLLGRELFCLLLWGQVGQRGGLCSHANVPLGCVGVAGWAQLGAFLSCCSWYYDVVGCSGEGLFLCARQ